MGRPTKSQDEKRTETVRFRTTISERAALLVSANTAGLDPSEFCRRRALGYRLPAVQAVADERLLVELSRIGNNLNQIAKAANAGRGLDGMTGATLAQLTALLDTLADRLEGENGGADGS